MDQFDSILSKAGAVFARHDGRPVVVNFGSAAGELAVCVRAVGLVDRSELTKLVLEAPAAQLAHLVIRLAGSGPAAGRALQMGGAWWCGLAADRVIVLCEPAAGARLRDRLRSHALHHVELVVRDHTEDWVAIALVGHGTPRVLRALGVHDDVGDAADGPRLRTGEVQGVEVTWLLESDRRALALVARERAGAVWRAVEDAGRPFGISCVGQDAASRYQLLERAGL